MYEIRIHGIGGEGVVRLSEMIGKAATDCNKWAHSFPFFGTEIRGAAVKAFTRVSDSPISIKSYIYEPDAIVVTNDSLLDDAETLAGLNKNGVLLVNTQKGADELGKLTAAKAIPIDATAKAYEIIGRPIVNTLFFGALIGVMDLLPVEEAIRVLKGEFSEKIAAVNIEAFKWGYDYAKKVI